MILSLIYAISQNGVIGWNNKLPWHIPDDLKYFKKVTMGKPIIMGRKTFESIGKPLPGRKNIVITRNQNWYNETVDKVHRIDEAFALCPTDPELMIIGGAEIFSATLSLAQKVYVTEIHRDYHGDCFLSPLDRSLWKETSRLPFQEKDDNPAFSFVIYEKK
jgi:dihydrofolate reductase